MRLSTNPVLCGAPPVLGTVRSTAQAKSYRRTGYPNLAAMRDACRARPGSSLNLQAALEAIVVACLSQFHSVARAPHNRTPRGGQAGSHKVTHRLPASTRAGHGAVPRHAVLNFGRMTVGLQPVGRRRLGVSAGFQIPIHGSKPNRGVFDGPQECFAWGANRV